MWARSRMRVMVWPRFLGQLAHYETIGPYRRSAWWHEGGRYQIAWDGLDEAGKPLSSGVYLVRLQALGRVETRKMMLMK